MSLRKAVGVFSFQRYRIAIVSFWGFMFVYCMRTDFSVAILCMTKSPNVTANSFDLQQVQNDTIIPNGQDDCQAEGVTGKRISIQTGEFSWDKQLQSKMLASFFYGYIITQIFGGWMSRKFGGKRVLGCGMVLCTLSTLLMPVCARAHVALVFVLRIIAGLGTGVAFPAMHCLWGRWAPPLERTKLSAIQFAGPPLGNIVTFPLSGYLCVYGFDNGWGSIFYIFGGAAAIWLGFWVYFVYDTPASHPRISPTERDYIETSIGDRLIDERQVKTPWLKIMKSPAAWAAILGHFCNNWTGYTLLTGLPTYMKEVLQFDIKQNGALSAVPYICMAVCSLLTGYVADTIRERQILTTVNTRRIFQCTAFVGLAVFMVATGYVTCENRELAVVFLSIATSFQSLCRSGYLVNHIDIAPRYAGEMFGITNTVATIPGMIAPLVNGALTPNKTQEEWQKVFFLCGGIALFGCLSFGWLVRGEVQPWARVTDTELAIEQSESPAIEDVCNPDEEKVAIEANMSPDIPDDLSPDEEETSSPISNLLPLLTHEYEIEILPPDSNAHPEK